jgi:large subunit ribosomal protein L29
MPILRVKEISSMSSEDRAKKLTELRTELARLRTMIRAGGAVENPARVRELRKAIAKILTIENESKLGLRETKEEPAKKTAKTKKKKEKKAE